MEFVLLRALQRGMSEIREALREKNGRIILTNKGQPAYLLIDLAGKNILKLVNFFDYYQSHIEEPAGEPTSEVEQALTLEEKAAAQNFIASMQSFRSIDMTPDVLSALNELESGKYMLKSLRELTI